MNSVFFSSQFQLYKIYKWIEIKANHADYFMNDDDDGACLHKTQPYVKKKKEFNGGRKDNMKWEKKKNRNDR